MIGLLILARELVRGAQARLSADTSLTQTDSFPAEPGFWGRKSSRKRDAFADARDGRAPQRGSAVHCPVVRGPVVQWSRAGEIE